MELSSSWEVANCVGITQELPSLLRNPKVHYCVHKSPPLGPNLSQIHPVDTIPSYLNDSLGLAPFLTGIRVSSILLWLTLFWVTTRSFLRAKNHTWLLVYEWIDKAGCILTGFSSYSISQSQSYVTTDGQSASLSWDKPSAWGLRPDFHYCQTVARLLMWDVLSDERTNMSFKMYNIFTFYTLSCVTHSLT
jgi:hypothetical protein